MVLQKAAARERARAGPLTLRKIGGLIGYSAMHPPVSDGAGIKRYELKTAQCAIQSTLLP